VRACVAAAVEEGRLHPSFYRPERWGEQTLDDMGLKAQPQSRTSVDRAHQAQVMQENISPNTGSTGNIIYQDEKWKWQYSVSIQMKSASDVHKLTNQLSTTWTLSSNMNYSHLTQPKRLALSLALQSTVHHTRWEILACDASMWCDRGPSRNKFSIASSAKAGGAPISPSHRVGSTAPRLVGLTLWQSIEGQRLGNMRDDCSRREQ
jgi:hypothetical protein